MVGSMARPAGVRWDKECEHCHESFMVRPSEAAQRFCSNTCRYDSNRRNIDPKPSRQCPGCGGSLSKKAELCRTCRTYVYRPCLRCGSTMRVKVRDVERNKTKYCTRLCSSRATQVVTRVVVTCCVCERQTERHLSQLAKKRTDLNFCSADCWYAYAVLDRNPRWSGGTDPQKRVDKEVRSWRKLVLARDNDTCQVCEATTELHVHHIKTFAKHPELRTRVDNGIVLCAACHRRTQGKEEKWELDLLMLLSVRQKERLVA